MKPSFYHSSKTKILITHDLETVQNYKFHTLQLFLLMTTFFVETAEVPDIRHRITSNTNFAKLTLHKEDNKMATSIAVQMNEIFEQPQNEPIESFPLTQQVHNVSLKNSSKESSPIDSQSTTIATIDSNPLLVPIRQVTEQDSNSTFQEDDFTLSTLNTKKTQRQN